jgi:hypothetical protein
MDEPRRAFLAGERPADVLMYFGETAVDGIDRLAEAGERVDNGVVLVVDGEQGRAAFQRAVGTDPMQFSQEAGNHRSTVAADCTGGVCPHAEDEPDREHTVRFVFAFVQEQNEEVGDIYAEGDVVHGYAQCTCGTAYSQRWVAGEREA